MRFLNICKPFVNVIYLWFIMSENTCQPNFLGCTAGPHLPRALHLAVAVLQNALPGQ